MITTSDALHDDSTEHPSKTARVASPDVEDADQSEDDDSDDDQHLEGADSSSKSGGVTSCSKSHDKARDSTKTRLKARGSIFAPVLRPEGSRDFYDTHLMVTYVYTGPRSSTKKSSEASAVTKPPPSATMKKVHCKNLDAGKGKEVQGPTSSSAVKNDADGHNLMLSTLLGGHGIFMAQTEPQDADWYDSDDAWYDPDDGWINPLPGAGSNAAIAAHLDELTRVAPDPVVVWNFPDEVFEIYFGQAGIDLYRARQEEDDFNAFGGDDHQEQGSVDDYDSQLVDSGATVHFVPGHVVNAMVAPAPPPFSKLLLTELGQKHDLTSFVKSCPFTEWKEVNQVT
jgi:hypothetical protein